MNDYHYIIIDTPPAGVLADALKIVKDLDGIVLIAKQECASIKVMQDTITLLEKAGGNIVGSILNDIRKRYIGSGYGYKLKYYAKQHYYYENQS